MTVSRSLVSFSLVALLLLGGCKFFKSDTKQADSASQAVESWSGMRANLEAANGQIDKTLLVMMQMTTAAPADLTKAHAAYADEVKATEAMAAKAKQRAADMRKYSAEYVRKWEEDMEQVSDPAMRESMTARKKAVSDNFADVRDAAKAVSAAYQPFDKTLNDISTAMSLDLTPGGLKTCADAMTRAETEGANLKDRIKEVIAALDKVQAAK